MAGPFLIDGWLAEADRNTFTRGDDAIRVEPKVMELCVRLAERPGAVVSKAELLDSVWPDATVGEDALTRAVSELRRALRDDPRRPRIVETIPKRGYRLIAAVQRPAVTGADSPKRRHRAHWWWLWASVTVLILIAAANAGWVPTKGADRPREPHPRLQVLLASQDFDDGAPLGGAVRQIVQSELEHGGLAVVTRATVAEALARMRRSDTVVDPSTALEIAARHPAIAVILTGALQEIPGGYQLQLRAISASDARVVSSSQVQGSEKELLSGARREAARIREALEQFTPNRVPGLPPVTTNSPQALRYFARGMEIADSALWPWSGTWPKAVGLFRQAVQEDREFATARAWLALATKFSEETELAAHGGVRDPRALFKEEARESLALASQEFLSDRERRFIEGVGFMLLERRHEAIAAFEALQAIDPSFFELRTRSSLALLYGAEGRPRDGGAQVLRLAELRPDDFDISVAAASVLLHEGEAPDRVAMFAERARQQITPAIAQRENSSFGVSWLEHLRAYQHWVNGDRDGALRELTTIAQSIPSRVSAERDAVATGNGLFWLTLGRLGEARRIFEEVGHIGQRELNLALLADLVDDRPSMRIHLQRKGWAYNPVPFARAGLFGRARQIIREPTLSGPRAAQEAIVRAEEALAAGEPRKAVDSLQRAVEVLRVQPHIDFFNGSLSLARAWRELGSTAQAIRVLEEAVQARPIYGAAGLPAAWWIKTQVRLVHEYRNAGRPEEAALLATRIGDLLANADADHPFLRDLHRD